MVRGAGFLTTLSTNTANALLFSDNVDIIADCPFSILAILLFCKAIDWLIPSNANVSRSFISISLSSLFATCSWRAGNNLRDKGIIASLIMMYATKSQVGVSNASIVPHKESRPALYQSRSRGGAFQDVTSIFYRYPADFWKIAVLET